MSCHRKRRAEKSFLDSKLESTSVGWNRFAVILPIRRIEKSIKDIPLNQRSAIKNFLKFLKKDKYKTF